MEIRHALGRKRLEGGLTISRSEVHRKIDDLLRTSLVIDPSDRLRVSAGELALDGLLRAADALQLAAALEARRVVGVDAFVTFDLRLATAARARGLDVLPQTP